jgi:phosphohistidine swiveling domain-containing protein
MRAFPLVLTAFLLSILALVPVPAMAQQLHCHPCNYPFGKVQIGTSVSYSFQLTNVGNKTLRINSKSIQGASSFSFGKFTLPMSVQPGASVQLPVIFTPTAKGYAYATLQLKSNDPNSPLNLHVHGIGFYPNAPQLAASPASLNFGNVNVGSNATLQTTLSASGAAVTISSDGSTSSVFAIVGLSLPVTIQVGQSLPVTVQFTPNAAGNASGNVSFTSNAVNSPTVVQVSGTGVAQQSPQLTATPASLNFGNVTVGSNASLQTTLSASGAAVTITSDGSTSSEFAIVGLSLPVTIQVGQSLKATVQFTPNVSGNASGNVSFTSNAVNSPTVVQVSGTGVAQQSPQLTATPASLNFGNVTVGSNASLQTTLSASGAAVTITSDGSTSSEFAIVGLNLPVTIQVGQSLKVTVQFAPNASGNASGNVGFTSNAVNSPTVVQVSGTGVAQQSHSVYLTWQPGDGNAVGYNIYRSTNQNGPFTEINSALDSSTNYTDNTVVSGTTYYYVTTEVNTQGQESGYSNEAQAVIPTP